VVALDLGGLLAGLFHLFWQVLSTLLLLVIVVWSLKTMLGRK
jgi:hypothetical protein